jgi:hypothetical protein
VHKFPFLEFSPFSGEAAPLLPPELVRKGRYDTILGTGRGRRNCDFGNYLRDFLVDFLRGPAKGVLPGEPKRSATQIIPKVPSTGQKLTKKTSTDQSGLEGSTARFFPISTGTGNCSGHQLRHPSFSSRQPDWSSVLKMSRISDRLNVKPLARQRLARFVFPSRSKRRRRRAIRAKRRLYVRITPVGCHTWRATGITIYLENDGRLEHAQQRAGHESPRTTKLYDRTKDEITLSEVERIRL